MDLKLLDAKAVSKRLRSLIEKHDEIHVAVAWGYNGPLADCLLNNKRKFCSVTFGLAFCQTDPDLVARLIRVKNAYVAEGGKGTFHPKIYYFSTGRVAEAMVGSSNFTSGGLDKNWEATVYAKGDVDEPFFVQLRKQLTDYADLRRSVTVELSDAYRRQFDAAKALKKAKDPILPGKGATWRQLNSSLVKMGWDEYVKAVRTDRHFALEKRLDLLRECQRMFAGVESFGSLSGKEWKAVAGVIGDREKAETSLAEHDWGWFGSMKGMGDFRNRVKAQDPWLARAIDSIPRHGEVTRSQYDVFCEHFVKAFAKSSRVGGVPTATRLLAMKRPDTFVCVSKPNRSGLAKALAFPPTTLNLENYWDRVIEPIRVSTWYNTQRPEGRNAELWDDRAAMLDAIYYAPG